MKYKVVLFDLDDTLCNTAESKSSVFKQLYNQNKSLEKISQTKFIEIAEEERIAYLKNANGHQTFARIEMWLEVVSKLKIMLSLRELKKLIDDYWKFSLSELILYPSVEKTLKEIRKNKIITGLLAGSDFYTKASKLMALKVDGFFDYVFTSDIVKLPKTDPAIYKYVADYLKKKPKDILMVGNDPLQDIAPANQAGMGTAQVMISKQYDIAKRGDKRPNYALYKIGGLLKILDVQ